jgi:hypothetical protein
LPAQHLAGPDIAVYKLNHETSLRQLEPGPRLGATAGVSLEAVPT